MNSRFSLTPIFGALSIAAVVGAIAACAQTSSSDSFLGDQSAGDADGGASPTNGAFARDDASTEKTDVSRGNPLCHVPPDPTAGCMPDDVHNILCPPPTSDGGDAAVASPTIACRVVKSDASSLFGPACAPVGPGADGAQCTTGDDCAAGFDCVAGDNGSFCRQYCCLGACGDPAASSSATFCDVQPLVDKNVVPVCMPLKPCKLLTDGECGPTESCAVVNENGDTGCVPVGQAHVGEPCDVDHCDRGLTCLGQPGNRKCQRLCKIGGDPICTAPQTCITTSAFKDSSYGICQAP